MTDLPTGTVTFLFTDIEGSTTLAQQYPAALPNLLARHHAILHEAIEAHHGHVFQIIGDAFSAAFYTAEDALNAALEPQRAAKLLSAAEALREKNRIADDRFRARRI